MSDSPFDGITNEYLKSLGDKLLQVMAIWDYLNDSFGRDYTNLFLSSLGESDRGAVLLLHSAIDDALRELIMGFLHKHAPHAQDEQEWLFSFQGSIPVLGSYAVKVRFSYAAGLIDEKLKDNLLKLGKIRNNPFAHAWDQSVYLQKSHITTLLAMVDKEFQIRLADAIDKDDKDRNRWILVCVCFYLLEKLFTRIHAITGSPAGRLPKSD